MAVIRFAPIRSLGKLRPWVRPRPTVLWTLIRSEAVSGLRIPIQKCSRPCASCSTRAGASAKRAARATWSKARLRVLPPRSGVSAAEAAGWTSLHQCHRLEREQFYSARPNRVRPALMYQLLKN